MPPLQGALLDVVGLEKRSLAVSWEGTRPLHRFDDATLLHLGRWSLTASLPVNLAVQQLGDVSGQFEVSETRGGAVLVVDEELALSGTRLDLHAPMFDTPHLLAKLLPSTARGTQSSKLSGVRA